MMNNFWVWVRSCFAMRKISATERMAKQLGMRVESSLRRLNKRQKQLRSLQRRLELISESLAEDLEESITVQRKYEETVEGLRSENKILTEVTLPLLTAQHRLQLTRYDAETAIEVRKQVAVSANMDRVGEL